MVETTSVMTFAASKDILPAEIEPVTVRSPLTVASLVTARLSVVIRASNVALFVATSVPILAVVLLIVGTVRDFPESMTTFSLKVAIPLKAEVLPKDAASVTVSVSLILVSPLRVVV